jgi:hypothetical protein
MEKVEIEKPADFMELAKSKEGSYLYYDHPSDGVDYFADSKLEDIGWNACVFPFLSYRVLAEFIEDSCDGTLYYNDSHMGFNGFVEITNIEDVRKKVKGFCISQIKENKLDEYDDDQLESLEFFGVSI